MLHYAKYGEPLFTEDLRAYEWGGIVYPVYKNFFSFYREPLNSEEINMEQNKKKFINKIYHYRYTVVTSLFGLSITFCFYMYT